MHCHRELDSVPVLPPANETEEVASQLASLRQHMTAEQRDRFDTVLWQEVAKRIRVDVDGTEARSPFLVQIFLLLPSGTGCIHPCHAQAMTILVYPF